MRAADIAMKTLLTVVALFFALKASAVPILQVTFIQANYQFDLTLQLTEGASGEFYINGVHLSGATGLHFSGDLDPIPVQFVIGENFPTAVVNGQTIVGPSFFITQPEGEVNVSDTGSTLGLLGLGMVLVLGLHYRLKRAACFSGSGVV